MTEDETARIRTGRPPTPPAAAPDFSAEGLGTATALTTGFGHRLSPHVKG